MKVVLQRVSSAGVIVDDTQIAAIGRGFLLLVGIESSDSEEQLEWMANKISGLRIFEDGDGKFNLSLSDVDGEILVVSQFTLLGDARKGRRPSFTKAAPPSVAEPLCSQFASKMRSRGFKVEEGKFGARMKVDLTNDGPVTLILER